MKANIHILVCFLLLFSLPVMAQHVNQKANRGAQSENVRQKKSLSDKLRIADSLRLELRRHADKGMMLQWGNSLLRARLDSGKLDNKTFQRLRKRLYKYDTMLHHGDSLLASNYRKVNFDTLYISRPNARWTIKLRFNLSGAKIKADGRKDGQPFHGELRSDYRGTLSAAVSYRGVAAGIAINPAKLAGKSKDNEFNLNSYGNRFGFDIVYLASKTYSGDVTYNALKEHIAKGQANQKALNINAYYVFNSRRFSFPAAFSQSYIQRHSAGSFMVGASLDGQTAEISGTSLSTDQMVKLKTIEFDIGAGYGYNLVAGSHWLFHLSALPTFDVLVKSKIAVAGNEVSMGYHFPDVIITGRGASVYSWRNKFAGATMVFNFSTIGDESKLQLGRDKWRIRFFYGFRF